MLPALLAVGFNEAEAFTPRIPNAGNKTTRKNAAASMRPRLLHLGSGTSRDQLNAMMRACFNEAEAFTPRIRFGTINL